MNKIILGAVLFLFSIIGHAQSTPGEQVATKIAQRLKDSLSLTEAQRSMLYDINIQLHSQKMQARQQYTDHVALGLAIQRIENTRDSIYHNVLTDPQYLLYRQKKRNLVNNN